MDFLNLNVGRLNKMKIKEINKIKEYVSKQIGVKEDECNVEYEKIPEVVKEIRNIKSKENLTKEKRIELLRIVPSIIDHTLLKAFASKEDIKKLCDEAISYNFYSACVNSSNVKLVKKLVMDKKVKVSSTVGFPLGAVAMKAKIFEARCAIEDGADELDVVLNIGKIKDSEYSYVYDELKEITSMNKNITVKVIIENCYLTDEEKVKASYIAKLSGAHFVKTSTGFGSYGAKVEDIKLMRETIGDEMGIKAAGGIKSFDILFDMVIAGATRIGTSSSINIVKG